MTRFTHHALAAILGTALLSGAAQAADSNTSMEASASATGDLAQRIESRAAHASSKAQAEAQAKLDAVAKKVDRAAAQSGDAKVAARLEGTLGTSAQALLEERADASWGNLVIAHTLAANAAGDVTARELVDLHAAGMGWGTIAAGLDVSMSQALRAAQAGAGQAVTAGLVTGATGGAVQAAAGASVQAASSSVGLSAGLGLGIGR